MMHNTGSQSNPDRQREGEIHLLVGREAETTDNHWRPNNNGEKAFALQVAGTACSEDGWVGGDVIAQVGCEAAEGNTCRGVSQSQHSWILVGAVWVLNRSKGREGPAQTGTLIHYSLQESDLLRVCPLSSRRQTLAAPLIVPPIEMFRGHRVQKTGRSTEALTCKRETTQA